MALVVKVIVTNRAAMRAKYGQAGWARIRAEVRKLVVADKARGVTTRMVTLDPASTPAQVKDRIDSLFAANPPDYLMILGANDVVPQCQLNNPLWTGNPSDDPDQFVPTDLPYACSVPLSTSCAAYRGVNRVVGRLPDLVGAQEPSYLLSLLSRAARWTSLNAARPLDVLAISTLTWRRSTQTSVAAIGGANGVVHTTPNEGPAWTNQQLNVPLLFVNCHGGQFDPTWYGEKFAHQATLPHAVDASRLRGLVRPGMTVASESCYGAMHWDPATAGGQPGVAATLLGEGAAGVWASSTTSYGPSFGNSGADIITRMFLETVVAGASIGRAALDARQRFVAHAVSLDPIDLKTLGQFELLGDPSVHPIAAVSTGPAGAPAIADGVNRAIPGVRQRRVAMQAIGDALAGSISATADPRDRAGLSRARFGVIAGIDATDVAIRSFDVQSPVAAGAVTGTAGTSETYHVAFSGAAGRRSVVVVRTEPGAPASSRRLLPKR